MILTQNAQIIFEHICEHARQNGIDISGEKETSELQLLAFHYDRYGMYSYFLNNDLEKMQDESGSDISAPDYVLMNESRCYIIDHSDKFGMNAAAREKINKWKPKGLN
jgi:hypothetical protein